ncbi:hypothetical protein Hanom_Chr04g00343301 [Helianthus anomalus]
MIICYLLAMIKSIGSLIYNNSESGVKTLKIIFESFHPSQLVASNGMNTFVDVLNFEEKKRDKKSSSYRLFLPSTMIVSFSLLITHVCILICQSRILKSHILNSNHASYMIITHI